MNRTEDRLPMKDLKFSDIVLDRNGCTGPSFGVVVHRLFGELWVSR